jgi:UDP-glucuronate 4-epimerase
VTDVVHLGAYAGVRYSVQNPWPYQEHNVRGTLTLLEAVRHQPVQRFLFASSSTVYGRGAASPFCEDAPLGVPMSPYGASKRAGELFALSYHDLFDVPVVCLRFFSVYGPRLRPDLAMTIFTASILDGRPLPLFGDGSIRRDFTHVSDVCTGTLAALAANDAVGQCLNLGHHEPIEVRHLIALLEEAIGQRAVIDSQPARPEDMPITCADLAKSQRILQYQPTVPFQDGVPEFVAWFRAAREKPSASA